MKQQDQETENIITALKNDHKDLKSMIKILKSEDANFATKKKTYALFADLLKSHSKSEEKAVYDISKKKSATKPLALEGYVEHDIAAALMKNIEKTSTKDEWVARAKVLAETVEHHIKEEEKEFFPELEKAFKTAKQEEMAAEFRKLRTRSQKNPTAQNNGILSV